MFFWYYPMDGLTTYRTGTAMGRLLMDMRSQIPPQNDVYFVAVDGESKGPYSFDELRALIRGKQVTRETYLWSPGMADWEFAANLPRVRPLVTAAPPPIPQPSEENEKP